MDAFLTELTTLIIICAALFLPGSAILIVSGVWRRWQGLQRLMAATGLGLAFYPILFYTTRTLLPQARFGRGLLAGILLLALLITLWGVWKERVYFFRPDRLEWIALLILGLTVASRLWFAHQYPFPAWSDSLHHVLLTKLTAESGRLPQTLEPYFPNVLNLYHLGLYALSGTVQILGQVEAHTALLWTVQVLNGLCGIGIYLVLDRYAGRSGAVLGLAVAGLFSAHPALWANWGRFTQLASVVLLPIAWAFFLELISRPGTVTAPKLAPRAFLWLGAFAASTAAAVFLYHFRVGIFYLLLLAATVLISLVKNHSREDVRRVVNATLFTGLGMLILSLPALWGAADAYLTTRATTGGSLDPAQREQLLQNFYVFPLSSVPYLAAPVWLLVIGGIAGLWGLIARNVLTAINLLWTVMLLIVGNLYMLGIPALSFTNLGAVLIMIYIPLSIVIGAGFQEALRRLPQRYLAPVRIASVAVILAAGLLAFWARATAVEPNRHFVTEQDIKAMDWISQNVPADAVFAINTYRWLPGSIHGTDAGYWLPYFTQRQIVTASMLSDGLNREYRRQVQARAEAAEALETDLGALAALRDLGVEYIYIGATGDFSGPGLRVDFLTQSDAARVLYSEDGVAVLRILAGGDT